MKYISTRDNTKEYEFEEVFIKGLADDGGLFIPKQLNRYSKAEIDSFKNLSYQDLAKKIIFPFIGDFMSENDLSKIKSEFDVKVHNFDDLDHYDDLDNVAALSAALDFVVSVKNTVPLITAGVGTPTKLANWRQSSWSNFLLNPVGPAVDIFEKNTWEPWNNVFSLIAEDISKST